jgi:N-acetylneuraminic acid mutarotase
VVAQPDEFINLMLQKATEASLEADFASISKMIKPFNVYWQDRTAEGHKPEAREGAAIVVINRRVFLFGGLSRDLYNDVRELRVEDWTWSQMQVSEGRDLPPEPRLGHVMLPYKHYLVIYGGCGMFDKTLRMRQCYSRVHVFDTGTFYAERATWRTCKPLGEQPEARRNHAAVIIGSSCLIYGGVSSNGKLLDDLHILNAEAMHWLKPNLSNELAKPGKLAYFTLTAVYPASIRSPNTVDVFHIPRVQDEVFNQKNCGVYLFGGVDRAGQAKNDVYVLKIKRFKGHGDGLFQWTLLKPAGTPPQPRYAHSTALVTKYLVIIGGRTNNLTKYGGYDLNEIAALNIEANRWDIIKNHGSYPEGRWGAVSCVLGSSLLYFGGMRLDKYSQSKMFIMEADHYNVGVMMAREAESFAKENVRIRRKAESVSRLS